MEIEICRRDMGLAKNKDFKKGLIQLAQRLHLESQVEWHSFAEKISRRIPQRRHRP